MNKNRLLFAICLLSLIIASTTTFAQVTVSPLKRSNLSEIDQQKFIQVKEQNNQPQSLQMANVRYVPKDNIPSDTYVDLISVVHIADKSYYEQLNQLFTEYDVVLYELVAEEGSKVTKQDKSNQSALSRMQNMMKDALGLSFQLDEIDYSKDNFVHADMSPKEFSQSMEDKGESFFSMFLRLYLVSLQQSFTNPNAVNNMDLMMAFFSDDKEKQLKRIAAKQFIDLDPVMNAIEGESGSTILVGRNLKALKVLREQLNKGKKKIAIFYGAAHMPDMAKVLKEKFNMKKDSVTWMDAWDLK